MDHFLFEVSRSCSLGSLTGKDCLFRVYTTCKSMLVARGYGAVDRECRTVDELVQRVQEGQPVLRGHSCPDKPDITLFFHIENKIGIKYLRGVVEDVPDGSIACFVSVDGPTAFTHRDTRDDHDSIHFLTFKQLFNDLSRHRMVPRHALVPPGRVAEVASKYNISKPSHWPRLLRSDPVAQFYDFRKGDLVEIWRTGVGTNGAAAYFRMVS